MASVWLFYPPCLEVNRTVPLYTGGACGGTHHPAVSYTHLTYGGRRYDRLSLSEKIRAGMEVSELMKRLTGRNYPTFVDNMESVDDLANVRPTGQVIMAKCVSNAPLQVRPLKPIVCVEQQAA